MPPAAAVRKARSLGGTAPSTLPSSENAMPPVKLRSRSRGDGAVEEREVGGRAQPLELVVAEPGGEVGAGEGGPDRHLVDDGGLRAALVASALERLVVVPAEQDGAEHRHRHEARGSVDDEQA